jgi:hypothetical protein
MTDLPRAGKGALIRACAIGELVNPVIITCEHNLTVVTRNVKNFSGLGVEVFNPWDL